MNFETQLSGDVATAELEYDVQRRRRRRIIWVAAIALAVVIIAAALIVGRGKSGAALDSTAQGPVAPVVTVIIPGQSNVDRTVSATGSLAARVEMPVAVVGEGGEVQRVLVQPGDWVAAGQPLAVIERSVQTEQIKSLAAQVEVDRADAKLAQAELERAQALVGRGFISKADIDKKVATRDAANARVNVAIAQLGEQKARTGRLDIRAPAAGLILTRTVEPGQVVAAGTGVLFRMAKAGEMEMLAQVSEGDLAGLGVGVPATVTPVGGAKSYVGKVWQISPVVDPQSRLGVARIALHFDKGLRPGGFASASIISGSGDAPLLPESAVQSDKKGSYVYVVDGGNHVRRRDVTIGQVSGSGVAIASGLDGREKVVATAGAFLTEGQKVKPSLQKAGA